jgi:hypothetical protein
VSFGYTPRPGWEAVAVTLQWGIVATPSAAPIKRTTRTNTRRHAPRHLHKHTKASVADRIDASPLACAVGCILLGLTLGGWIAACVTFGRLGVR